MKQYNRFVESMKYNDTEKFKALYDEIFTKLGDDTSDRKMFEVCLLVLENKIEQANEFKRKKKNIFFERELLFANTIIHSIFASRYSIVVVNGYLTLMKKIEK